MAQNKLLRLLKLIALLKQEPPKTINYIARFLDTSTRTAYRYIKLLEQVNFTIHVDQHHKYSILPSDLITATSFNAEEITFLQQLVQSAGSQHPVAKSIAHKLSQHKAADETPQDLYQAKLANFIWQINTAINQNQQVIFKQYQSINSQNIADRLVEPIKFTADYKSVCAFEVAAKQNKFFNIERIGEIELLQQAQQFEHWHQFKKPDVFGFSKNDKVYVIDLELNLKAKLLLTEEYPFTKPYVQTIDKNTYRFKAQIYNKKPIKRFYNGLQDDIKVLPGTDFNLENQ